MIFRGGRRKSREREKTIKKRTKKKNNELEFYEWKERGNISLKIPNKRCHSREKG